jgi:hypothetical protein
MSLSSILKRLVEDAPAEPSFDFSHVPQNNDQAAVDPELPPAEEEEELPPTDEPEAPEEEVEESEAKTTRLLSMDKRKANVELKELCTASCPAIPLSKIKEILAKYKLQISEPDLKFIGRASNKDVALSNTSGVGISNSQLVLYWNRDTETSFTVNAYLS